MSDPIADKRKRFIRKFYKPRYGPFPCKPEEKEEMAEWFRFIDKLPVNRMADLFDAVTDKRGKSRYRPMLEDFERAWRGITGEQGKGRRRVECSLCYSTGFMSVIGHNTGGEWKLGYDALHTTIVQIPCLCSNGKRYGPQEPTEAQQQAKEWILTTRSELEQFNEGRERPLDYLSYLDAIDLQKKHARYNRKARLNALKHIMPQALGSEVKVG